MPKIFLYITAKYTWIFVFYGSDFNENRAHVHVGKRGMNGYCKIWLEPEVTIANSGELTPAQIKQVVRIASENKDLLLAQWEKFKEGKPIKPIIQKK